MIARVNYISSHISDMLRAEYNKEEHNPHPRPSSAGYCALKVWRQCVRGEPQEMDDSGLYNTWKGRALHKAMEELITSHGGDIFSEFNQNTRIEIITPHKFKVEGESDLFAKLKINDTCYVVDWKFPNQKSYQWTKFNNKPQQHYVDQLLIYAYGHGVKRAILVYCGEWNQFLEYEIIIDDELMERTNYLLKKFDLEYEAKSEDELSSLSIPEESWECNPKFCQFYDECVKQGRIKEDSKEDK